MGDLSITRTLSHCGNGNEPLRDATTFRNSFSGNIIVEATEFLSTWSVVVETVLVIINEMPLA